MSIQPHQQAHAENLILARLQVHERNAVQRASVVVDCAAGQTLLNANTHSDYVFFPIDTVVALVRSVHDGGVDVALVGSEGVIGCDPFIDGRTQVDDAVVRSAGNAYCMPADDFRRQFERRGGLQHAVLRFASAYLGQLGQNAACSRFHPLEARLARWLLMIHDRSASSDIDMTAQSIAASMAADGTEVEAALARLARTGAIRQRRQTISIVEAEALEVRACECYETLRQSYARTLTS